MSSTLRKLFYKSSLWCLVHTWGNDTLLFNKNKPSGDWTGALCVHVLHLQTSGKCLCLCLSCSQRLLFVWPPRGPGCFVSQRGRREEQTYLPPLVGLPTGASPRPTGLLCPRPRQMNAVLLLYFGLVLINTGYLPLLGPPTTTYWTLEREKEIKKVGGMGVGWRVRKKRGLLVKSCWRSQLSMSTMS